MTPAELEADAIAGGRCGECGANEQSCAARGGCCRLCTHEFEGDDPTPPQPVGSVAEQLIRRALSSGDQRLIRQGKTITEAVLKLKAELELHAGKAELRKRQAQLEQELAAVKSQLRGGKQPRPKPPPGWGTHKCVVVGCGRSFEAAQGLLVHRRRAHPEVTA